MQNINLFLLGEGVYEYYCENVSGNKNISYELVKKKLTRNILLTTPIEPKREGQQLYLYGNLHILVVNNTIVWIRNYKRGERGHSTRLFNKNTVEYERLSKILEIPEEVLGVPGKAVTSIA